MNNRDFERRAEEAGVERWVNLATERTVNILFAILLALSPLIAGTLLGPAMAGIFLIDSILIAVYLAYTESKLRQKMEALPGVVRTEVAREDMQIMLREEHENEEW